MRLRCWLKNQVLSNARLLKMGAFFCLALMKRFMRIIFCIINKITEIIKRPVTAIKKYKL
jgi:hypothetical protein